VRRTSRRYLIERHGRPSAAITSVEDLERSKEADLLVPVLAGALAAYLCGIPYLLALAAEIERLRHSVELTRGMKPYPNSVAYGVCSFSTLLRSTSRAGSDTCG
jgi:hypothetical protein